MSYSQPGLALVLFTLSASPFLSGVIAAQEDSVKAELDIAKRIYTNSINSAKKGLLRAFDDEMKKVAKKGDLDGYKALKVDKELVKRGGELLASNPMRKYQLVFYKKVLDARKSLADALDSAVKKYTMNLEIDKATKVQNELKALRKLIGSDDTQFSDIPIPDEEPELSGVRPSMRLKKISGSKETEPAVLAALEWLWRHQDVDGGWKAAGFNNPSIRERRGPSANKDSARYPKDTGWEDNDMGVTGLAILAFTGFGHTHMEGEYDKFSDCLKKAVKYMLKSQTMRTGDPVKDGRYGSGDSEPWIYSHAIATMAMAELLLMSNDFQLNRSVKEATKLCLRAQNDGRGWRYGVKPGDNDSSVTALMIKALFRARQCDLGLPKQEFQNAFGGALKWFEYATAPNGKTGYNVPGDEGSRLSVGQPAPYPFSKNISSMTAAGVLCRILAGQSREDPSIRRSFDTLRRQPPMWREQKGRLLSTINMYYWYYGTYAMYQYGGISWTSWERKIQRALLGTQRAMSKKDPAEVDGSWDPIGEWGISGGRVYSTALGARILEVDYRFERKK